MTGEKRGVKALAEATIDGIKTVGCGAHKTALVIKWSILEFPEDFLSLIRNINSMFNSSHRKHDFKELQAELDIVEKSILNYKEVRWLSLENVVNRILEQWDAVRIFA